MSHRRVTWGVAWLLISLTLLAYLAFSIRSEMYHYRAAQVSDLNDVKDRIHRMLHFLITELKTISRLPGVRALSSKSRGIDPQSTESIQEIYNSLTSNTGVSKLYILTKDFDPDRIDPRTGRPYEPLATFDDLIVGKVGSSVRAHPQEVPEIEIFEYRLMRSQILWFQVHFPSDKNTHLLEVPSRTGPEVITCDNSRFDPHHPNDKDRSGLVLSVPFYGEDFMFSGIVSGILLSRKLQELLPPLERGQFVIENSAYGYKVENEAVASQDSLLDFLPGAISEKADFKLDAMGDARWSVSLQVKSSIFWKELSTIKFLQVLFLQLLFIVGLIGFLLLSRRKLVRQKIGLEKEILLQGDELKLQQELMKSYEQLKHTQAQLVHSEKMASLGVIAAGIAHEINNPLSYVISNAETLRDSLKEWEAASESQGVDRSSLQEGLTMVEEILDGGIRIKDIVQGLRHFSRLDEDELKTTEINECILTALKLLSNELKHGCEVVSDLGPLPPIPCFPGQLIQVFTNLILNSVQAMKGVGTIWITTRVQNSQIRIDLRDSGPGIKPEDLKNIFTPFFTTKPVGQGTGLGLSISLGIIQKHSGTIEVLSDAGQGAQFTIHLPLSNHPAQGL